MPIIQRKAKMNDFCVASMTRNHKVSYHDAYRGALAYTVSNMGNYLSALSDDASIYVYHMEKKRAKFVQKKKQVKNGSGGAPRNTTVSTKVRDAQWTVRVFKVPRALVKSVKQHSRHFVLVLK